MPFIRRYGVQVPQGADIGSSVHPDNPKLLAILN
jgi:hypothetical protein